MFTFSKVIMAMYILFNLDGLSLGTVRIGADILGEEWNANTIGMNMAISALILIVLIKKSKVTLVKLRYIFLIILFSTLASLNESHNAIYIQLSPICLYISFIYFYIFLLFLLTSSAFIIESKKALFILFFSIGLYSILSSKKYKISESLITLIIGSLGVYLIFNIPFLYEVLGSRIESLLADF